MEKKFTVTSIGSNRDQRWNQNTNQFIVPFKKKVNQKGRIIEIAFCFPVLEQLQNRKVSLWID